MFHQSRRPQPGTENLAVLCAVVRTVSVLIDCYSLVYCVFSCLLVCIFKLNNSLLKRWKNVELIGDVHEMSVSSHEELRSDLSWCLTT